MDLHEQYFLRPAAAFIRGKLTSAPPNDPLFHKPLVDLTEEEQAALFERGRAAGLKLHKFKRTMGLPRVRKVLGMLRGLHPADLLDVGTGRGVFLWPLLDAFPTLPITTLDVLEHRVADLQATALGGLAHLHAHNADIRETPFPDDAFDGVTLLETLEHIPEPPRVLAEVHRLARRFVILSVPSKPDDNPEHIHLFTRARLQALLESAGFRKLHFDAVLNHLIVIAFVR